MENKFLAILHTRYLKLSERLARLGIYSLIFSRLVIAFLLLLSGSLWGNALWAQSRVPSPPNPPSRSQNYEGAIQPNSGSQSFSDPSFPRLELVEAPLQVPGSLLGGNSQPAEMLYRKIIIEVLSGYIGSVLSLYDISESNGNAEGNTKKSEWNNLYNILLGLQFSGNVERFHYNIWFGVPFNLGLDKIQLLSYEYGATNLAGYDNNDISYRGTFDSKLTYMLLGGFKIGANLVDRKSAQFILGFGTEGFLGQWEISGGNYRRRLQLNLPTDEGANYSGKSLGLLSGHVLPYLYLQGSAFLTPYLELAATIGYSPATIWFAEENRFQGFPIVQYRRYGFLGQTLLGEIQTRFWIGRRFALKLGLSGRLTLKTAGSLRTYDIDDAGVPVDPTDFTLTPNGAAMQYLQVSAFIGVGLALDGKLPPGVKYPMKF